MKKILITTVLTEAFYKSRQELILELLKIGYEVILVGPENDPKVKEIFNTPKVTYYQTNIERTGLNFFQDIKTIMSIIQIIKKEKPTITYSFGGAKAVIYTAIASDFCKVRKKYSMVNGLGSIYRGTGIKNRIVKFIMNILFRYSLKRVDGVLFQNRDDLNVFSELKLVNINRTLIVNGSGVNLSKFPYSEPTTKNLTFLFVGRLLKDKGIYEFIELAKKFKNSPKDIKFVIVGGFDTNPTSVKEHEMNKWVKEGLVKYVGKVNNVVDYYKNCSVFILPSYHEGTPRTSLEAMAVGRPIITTDAPGCRETVINGKNGFMVPIRDVDSLIDKVEYFIDNPNMVKVMGLESHHLAKDKYDVKKVNHSILNYLLKE